MMFFSGKHLAPTIGFIALCIRKNSPVSGALRVAVIIFCEKSLFFLVNSRISA